MRWRVSSSVRSNSSDTGNSRIQLWRGGTRKLLSSCSTLEEQQLAATVVGRGVVLRGCKMSLCRLKQQRGSKSQMGWMMMYLKTNNAPLTYRTSTTTPTTGKPSMKKY